MPDDKTAQAAAMLHQAQKLIATANELLGNPIQPRRPNNSAGVALSWDDPIVRAKRTKRWTCYVDGQEFSSVNDACQALKYKHLHSRAIAWRGRLVEDAERGGNGLKDDHGRTWQVMPK